MTKKISRFISGSDDLGKVLWRRYCFPELPLFPRVNSVKRMESGIVGDSCSPKSGVDRDTTCRVLDLNADILQ